MPGRPVEPRALSGAAPAGLLALSLAAGLFGGCFSTHGPGAGGGADGGEADALASLGPPPPCTGSPAAERCGCIDGLPRCDPAAGPGCGPGLCPEGTLCHAELQVCVPLEALPEPCQLVLYTEGDAPEGAERAQWAEPCGDPGQGCAVAEPAYDGGSDIEPLRGACMPRSFCLRWMQARGREQVACYEPGGTLVRSAGEARCPAPEPVGRGRPEVLYCGPGCVTQRCPYWQAETEGETPRVVAVACLGYAEGERPYGLCPINPVALCIEGEEEHNRWVLSGCVRDSGERRCACMRTEPMPPFEGYEPGRDGRSAYVVPLAHCRTYRRRFPGSVACLDARFEPLD